MPKIGRVMISKVTGLLLAAHTNRTNRIPLATIFEEVSCVCYYFIRQPPPAASHQSASHTGKRERLKLAE